MIIIKLQGGLGNQMFQYAFGERISYQKNVKVKFDTTAFRDSFLKDPYREYGLGIFPINLQKASYYDIWKVSGQMQDPFSKGIKKSLAKFFNYSSKNNDSVFLEKNIKNNYKNLPDRAYLEGFWASEKYFKVIAPLIREQFKFPKIDNSDYLKEITNTNSVAIHIRRGDYLKQKHRGTCSLDYYRNAVSYLEDRVKEPKFFVFSDDIKWAKEKFTDYEVIDRRNRPDYEDMHLMSLCNHNIISNSTFSWWAAWLNTNPDKYVIAPDPWFDHRDLKIVPDRWSKFPKY